GQGNRECLAQGGANFLSGLFGGIPGAGATMGTVVNIQTGGRTAVSGLVRAAILMVVVLWAGALTAYIPLAVLAGIAIKVGADIIDWAFIKRAHRVSAKTAVIMYGVIALTVFVDLIAAVAVGLFIANVLTIDRMVRAQSQSVKAVTDGESCEKLNRDEQMLLNSAGGKILVFRLGGPLIFGIAKAISRQNAVLDAHEILVMDFTDVPMLGVSSSLALENMVVEDLGAGRPVFIAGARGDVRKRLEKLGLLARLPDDHVVDDRQTALERASELLDGHVTEAGGHAIT
ncbi:MAG: SulP family inorganic anion transporter, partial [Gammaproteobacteria bacterium]